MNNFERARYNMIECQLRTSNIVEKNILNAFYKIPREDFLPISLKQSAYVDDDLVIDEGCFLVKPVDLAKLLQEANLKPNDFTMVVGCMTGYTAAIVSQLVSTVMYVISDKEKLASAQEKIEQLGINNCIYMPNLHSEGYADQAPYDVIFMCGCLPKVPEKLLDQLADGGRCIAVENAQGVKSAVLYQKKAGFISRRVFAEAQIQEMSGFQQDVSFEF